MGRCVYTGIYEPGHPTADERRLPRRRAGPDPRAGVTLVRYPGGNFVSGYRWEDGIGPVADRPTRRDLAWHTLETNAVGIDEFVRWAGKAGRRADVRRSTSAPAASRRPSTPTSTSTTPAGTALSDRRRANGTPEPVRHPMLRASATRWTAPGRPATRPPRVRPAGGRGGAGACDSAEPDLELVACGSSSSAMPTFGAWEATVLEQAYDQVDYISAHAYYEELDGDLASFLASAVDMDHFIDSVVATADSVGARLQEHASGSTSRSTSGTSGT